MNIEVVNNIRAPFGLLRTLVPYLDSVTGKEWGLSSLARPIFHREGTSAESLSERQTPENQLRYYTSARILRGLRRIAIDYSGCLPDGVTIVLPSFPPQPDLQFLEWLGASTEIVVKVGSDFSSISDSVTDEFFELMHGIRTAHVSASELSAKLSEWLSFGDSWSARLVADEYLAANESVDPRVADVLGIPFALQGDTGTAKLIWEVWSGVSPLEEARARYSLSMLEARHHPRALLNQASAEVHLEAAFDCLQSIPDSPQVTYERVFNRNGISLLLFRQGRLAEARDLLESGIKSLSSSVFAQNLHHTVLTSNLARVVQAQGDSAEAETLYRSAVDMDPKFAEYHQDLASFLSDQHRYAEALAEVECAIGLDPSMPEAYRLAGFILMEIGEPGGARDRFFEAATLGDDMAVVDMLRASFAAGSVEWTSSARGRVQSADLPSSLRAEAELILAQADCEIDSGIDATQVLVELREKFPDEELIESAWLANTNG